MEKPRKGYRRISDQKLFSIHENTMPCELVFAALSVAALKATEFLASIFSEDATNI